MKLARMSKPLRSVGRESCSVATSMPVSSATHATMSTFMETPWTLER
jgi:hypothetical protein